MALSPRQLAYYPIMDIKRLTLFADLARDLHFAKTSQKHNMSPSTLSRTIERMEQEGLISAANHAGKREILVPGEDETI